MAFDVSALANILSERDSLGANLATNIQTITISSTLTRNIFTRTNTNASTARINNAINAFVTIGNWKRLERCTQSD